MKKITLGKGMSAFYWNSIGMVSRMLMQVIVQITFARILGPSEVGLFAIGSVVLGLSNLLCDVGLAYGLIQKKNITDIDISFVFAMQLLLAIFSTSTLFLFSMDVANFFNKPDSVNVLKILSLVLAINAVSAVSLNLLKRELNFKTISISYIYSYFIGYVVIGVSLAILGWGAISMAVAWLAQAVLNLLFCYKHTRHTLRPVFWHSGAKESLTYAGVVFFTNLINWFSGGLDKFIIGKFYLPQSLAFYTVPYNLLYGPSMNITSTIQSTLFSVGAQDQGDFEKMKKGYLNCLNAISTIMMPLYIVIFLMAENIILHIYGAQWVSAASLLKPISIAMFAIVTVGATTPYLWNSNKPSWEMKCQLFIVALLIVGMGWGVAKKWDIASLAWLAAVVSLLRALILVIVTQNLLQISWDQLARAFTTGLVISGIMFLGDNLFLLFIPALSPWVRLFLFVIVFIVVLRVRYVFLPEQVKLLLENIFKVRGRE